MALDISRKSRKDVEILRLRGNVNNDNAADLKDLLKGICDEGRRKVVLDLGNVDYINSMGIGAIMAGTYAIQRCKGELRICGVRENISELLKMVRFDKIVKIYADIDEAIERF
ncbi:MAG: STAS domain-containing protein [bacterium]